MTRKLTRYEEDVFREIATLGSGFASNSLSKMIEKEVMVSAPVIEVKSIEDMINEPKIPSIGTILSIRGEMSGAVVILSEKEEEMMLLDIIKKDGKKTMSIKEEEIDIIKEVGNIMVGSYLSVISDMSKLNIIESTPKLVISDTRDILRKTIEDYAKGIRDVVAMKTKIDIDNERMEQDLILIMNEESLNRLFNAVVKNNRVNK